MSPGAVIAQPLVGAHEPERMAADIEAFVIALDEDLISADDFAR